MTIFKHGRTVRYDFWWHRHRFKATRNSFASMTPNTSNARSASTWPAAVASCLSSGTIHRHFTCARKVYFQHVSRRIKRSDILERTLRIVLKFCGARPIEDEPVDPNTRYYDLRF